MSSIYTQQWGMEKKALIKLIIYVGEVNMANFLTRQTGKQELPVSGDSADFLNVQDSSVLSTSGLVLLRSS